MCISNCSQKHFAKYWNSVRVVYLLAYFAGKFEQKLDLSTIADENIYFL